MLLAPDVVLALLCATRGQDVSTLLQVLASSALVYGLCVVAMARARRLVSRSRPGQLGQHDALIQGGQGLMLSLYAAALHLPAGSAGRHELDRLLDEGDRWLAQSRLALQLQREADCRLEQQLAELPQCSGWPGQLAYRVSVQGRAQALPLAIRQASLQAVQAVLESALPAGRQVEVELLFGRDVLRLYVRHDGSATTPGQPFDAAVLARLLPPAQPGALQVWSGAAGLELLLQFALHGTAQHGRCRPWQQHLYPF
ncbi:hypothetical protein [Duganella qianjiadongensis]|uniref:Histidine kinase n=1 Tax=Duganella qianjiadongensis TaxID=2692176 RepID=A0ABW9VJT7_9BURK|nr:hypothetical protein [Duganella qianjiadongensis]MYM38798.1 hypothetical protein [Duganella qianjiadongensis]